MKTKCEDVYLETDINLIHLKEVLHIFSFAGWTKDRKSVDILQMLSSSSFIFLLRYTPTNEPIGFARVITDFTYRSFIEDVIIIPEFQNKGYGKYLIEKIETLLKKMYIERVEITSQKDYFWEKIGYNKKDGHYVKILGTK